jgi:hypothetical protein
VTPDPEKPDIGPVAYPAEAILTVEQVSKWLQVSERTVKSWPLPRLRLPGNTVRFSAGMILRYLEGKDAA